MCGIAGLIGGDERTIRTMTAALRHRGPDDENFFQDNNIWLGHRRLSIIDIEGGRQPMVSPDGKVLAVSTQQATYFFNVLPDSVPSQGRCAKM